MHLTKIMHKELQRIAKNFKEYEDLQIKQTSQDIKNKIEILTFK
jgi:hypothetical protein